MSYGTYHQPLAVIHFILNIFNLNICLNYSMDELVRLSKIEHQKNYKFNIDGIVDTPMKGLVSDTYIIKNIYDAKDKFKKDGASHTSI
jgi:hypothetical protein